MLDYRIETFLNLCDTMSYTKTAEQLHITQPTVTQHIQYLEKQYHVKLFSYSGKKLSVTNQGIKLQQFAQGLLANCENFITDFQSSQQPVTLRMGATKTIGEYIMPTIVSEYLSNSCNNIELHVENTAALLDMLHRNKIEFALIEGYFNKSEYEYYLLKNVPFICVCSPDNPLANGEAVFDELLQNRIFVREYGSGTRNITEEIIQGCCYTTDSFSAVTEISNFAAIIACVKANLGITFVYETVVKNELADGTLKKVDIAGLNSSREFNFVFQKNSIFSTRYKDFYEFCRSVMTK